MGIFHFGESSSNLRSGTKSGALRAAKEIQSHWAKETVMASVCVIGHVGD